MGLFQGSWVTSHGPPPPWEMGTLQMTVNLLRKDVRGVKPSPHVCRDKCPSGSTRYTLLSLCPIDTRTVKLGPGGSHRAFSLPVSAVSLSAKVYAKSHLWGAQPRAVPKAVALGM